MNTFLVEKKSNYAIVTLNRGRSNPINHEMVKECRLLFKELLQDDTIQGVILAGKEGFFSAGLDVIELFSYSPAELESFWYDFSDMVVELTAFHKPLVAAITGHSPAGGCVLAICCDYRVMAGGNYRIGLNEIPVGIGVPPSIFALYAFWLGEGLAYQYLIEGKLLTADEAKQVGLVNEVTPVNEVVSMAEVKLKQYLSYAPDVWQLTKRNLRAKLVANTNLDKAQHRPTLEQWWKPSSRAILGKLVEHLSKK